MTKYVSSDVRSSALQWPIVDGVADYWTDALQRTGLFIDVMRKRGERYSAHAAKVAPHVLKFKAELVMDGRQLPRPVNYVLARVLPSSDIELDQRKRPFVVVDPRAGHGPGIGGFKADSEIGVAIKAGHPCYFIGFLPDPVEGQTIHDISLAEAAFLERVIALHPEAEGKPAVIGNCQAGWAVMMLAAVRPELFGPLIIAGSPLSYWAGVHGKNPMRYTGGLLGGTWLTALIGDLGNGKFDGAWLVSNFENLNPSNTYWSKAYNLYSKVDTERARYLEFEEWWGGHVMLNSEEMQFIADELFVGNKLASGDITTSDGTRIDLRNIRSPIVVFCSKGDDITPPQQALDWILDLYKSVDEIRANGQTIVYALHESAGHLGIFVSASVARKEHDEFASNIDLIDVLPPGLYEAVLTPKSDVDRSSDLVAGDYLVRFVARTLDDIRELGANSEADDRCFATAARVSEINLGLYRTFMRPWVRALANDGMSDWMRALHPLRLQYEMFSEKNPLLSTVEAFAHVAQEPRRAVPADNPIWRAQEQMSENIAKSLDAYRDWRDAMFESTFFSVYGSPLLQALVGLKASDRPTREHLGQDSVRRAFVERRIEEIKRAIPEGGPREAAIRALLYVRMPEGMVDERVFNLLRRVREEAGSGLSLGDFKRIVREQYFMLQLDEKKCLEAIPLMMARDRELAAELIDRLHHIVNMLGQATARERLAELEPLLTLEDERTSARRSSNLPAHLRSHTPSRSQEQGQRN